MCTCMTYENGGFYFGRNLDLEYSFGERVMMTPRNYELIWKKMGKQKQHYAMIGMAGALTSYPLYAEAVNEKGLCMAGLYFPGNAFYGEAKEGMKNVSPFELIPWVLASCASVHEAREHLDGVNIVKIPYNDQLPLPDLHWMLADEKECLVLEPGLEGLEIYENPYGVLTNNPPFSYHEQNLTNYRNITAQYAESRFAKGLKLPPYGQGMGGLGLPGDASSVSRFVRAAFLKWNSVCEKEEQENVSQVFHILDNVSVVRGAVLTPEGNCDITRYSCCINAKKGIYYFKTYGNSAIQMADLRRGDLDGERLLYCEPASGMQIPERILQ